jgi:hypothetical protein
MPTKHERRARLQTNKSLIKLTKIFIAIVMFMIPRFNFTFFDTGTPTIIDFFNEKQTSTTWFAWILVIDSS